MLRTTCRALLLVGATALLGATASRVAAESTGWLLVANKGDRSISIIDPAAGKQVAAVPVGGVTGHELVASVDGTRAYVPIYGDSGVGKPGSDGQTMAVVDPAGRQVVRTLDFGHGVRPHHPVVGPKDGLLYVTTEIDNTIAVVDPKTLKIVRLGAHGPPRVAHAGHHPGRPARLYGQRRLGDGLGPRFEQRKTVAVVPISSKTQRIALSVD